MLLIILLSIQQTVDETWENSFPYIFNINSNLYVAFRLGWLKSVCSVIESLNGKFRKCAGTHAPYVPLHFRRWYLLVSTWSWVERSDVGLSGHVERVLFGKLCILNYFHPFSFVYLWKATEPYKQLVIVIEVSCWSMLFF